MNILNKKTTVLAIALFALTTTYAQRGGNDNGDERRQGPPSVDEIFEKLDKNEDDKISLKEVKGPLKDDFSKIDTDEDGFITKEELEKAPKPERRERREN